MADKVNISSITDLISAFRQITAKDSITPESLGYILQRIADLLGTVNTSEVASEFSKLLNILRLNGNILTNIVQGQADRNHIYADISTVNLSNGETGKGSGIFIQQATTERAGAMRAQQVTDLNTARNNINGKILPELESIQNQISGLSALTNNVSNLLKQMSTLQSTISDIQAPVLRQLSCQIVGSTLKLRGAEKFKEAGYVPYLFRFTRKRNQIRDKKKLQARPERKYSTESKGWNLYGSCYTVQVIGNDVSFATNPGYSMTKPAYGYNTRPETIIRQSTNKKGLKGVAWGRKIIRLGDKFREYRPRMIRLRFAIAYGPRMTPGQKRITPAQMVSSLAEFSIIYDPHTEKWTYGK